MFMVSVAKTKMVKLWVAAPCSLVEVYQSFRGSYCLHHQGDAKMSNTCQLELNSRLLLWVENSEMIQQSIRD
jgi:hypothetical protein